MAESKKSLNVIKSNIRIAQVQAKDVLSKKEKLSRYNSASFDYSMDLITLQDVYKRFQQKRIKRVPVPKWF